jgi:hypothetical protein
MKEIKITSNGIKQAIDDLVDENERLQYKVYKLEDIIKEVRDKLNTQLAFTSSYQLNYQSAMSIIEETKSILQGVDKN